MTDNGPVSWSVLMPVKVLAQAKSRLAGLAGLDGPRRGELALALARDTVTAVLTLDEHGRIVEGRIIFRGIRGRVQRVALGIQLCEPGGGLRSGQLGVGGGNRRIHLT